MVSQLATREEKEKKKKKAGDRDRSTDEHNSRMSKQARVRLSQRNNLSPIATNAVNEHAGRDLAHDRGVRGDRVCVNCGVRAALGHIVSARSTR